MTALKNTCMIKKAEETTQDSDSFNTWDRPCIIFTQHGSEINEEVNANAKVNARTLTPQVMSFSGKRSQFQKHLWREKEKVSSSLNHPQNRKSPECEDTGQRAGRPDTDHRMGIQGEQEGDRRSQMHCCEQMGEKVGREALETPQWWEKRGKETVSTCQPRGIRKKRKEKQPTSLPQGKQKCMIQKLEKIV